jgi:hypothetical protein
MVAPFSPRNVTVPFVTVTAPYTSDSPAITAGVYIGPSASVNTETRGCTSALEGPQRPNSIAAADGAVAVPGNGRVHIACQNVTTTAKDAKDAKKWRKLCALCG